MSKLAPWQVPRTPEEIIQRNEEIRIRKEREAVELADSLAMVAATQTGQACKGPWTVGPLRYNDEEGEFFYIVSDADGLSFLDVFASNGHETSTGALSTARLIAAAPEMLAALRDVRDFLKSSGYDTRLIREVVDTAEGRS